MAFEIKKAVRYARPLKISLEALSGAGKTFTSLRTAFAMRRAGIGKKIVVADSENESAALYAGTEIDGEVWDYETVQIPIADQTPLGYTAVYEFLVKNGFDIIIIDSMTHAWKGALAKVDAISSASRSKDAFSTGWKAVTPEQDAMMRKLTDSRAHLITTTRVKAEYDKVEGANGKQNWGKIGVKADQREGMEYEYDVLIRMEPDHRAIVEKVRGCTAIDGKSAIKPGPDFWQPLFDWWKGGAVMPEPTSPPVPAVEPDKPKGLGAEKIEGYKRAMTFATTDKEWKDVFTEVYGLRNEMRTEDYQMLVAVKDVVKKKFAEPASVVAPVIVTAEPAKEPDAF